MECRRGLAMRFLSVRLSVKSVHCDKMKEKSVFSFSLVFCEEEWWVGATPSTWNFGSTGRRWSEIADFEPIFARSSSAVRPSDKSLIINTNRKSPTRFPMSLRWTSYVVPNSQPQNGRFPCKIALRLMKVCYEVKWRRKSKCVVTYAMHFTQ